MLGKKPHPGAQTETSIFFLWPNLALSVLPNSQPFCCRSLQRQQILEFSFYQSFEVTVCPSLEVKAELPRQVTNLKLSNRKSIVALKPQRWVGELFVKDRRQGPGSRLEAKDHINILELKAEKFEMFGTHKNVSFVVLP